MSDFERSKRTIGRHIVMVTSWFDDATQSWRASAPAYAYLSALMLEAHGVFPSRNAAIDKLSSLLEGHFSTEEGAVRS